MTTKENIKRLVKLHLMQNNGGWQMLSVCYAILFIIQIISTSVDIYRCGEDVNLYFSNMTVVFFGLFSVAIVNGVQGYTILCDDGISMYPGTMKSRLISRLISDHIIVVRLIALSAIVYILQAVAINVMSQLSDAVIVGSAFSMRYLLWGMLRTLGFAFAANGLWTLWYILANRFPKRFYGVVLILFAVAVFLLVKVRESRLVVSGIIRLYLGTTTNYPAYTGILLCLGTWLVCIALGYAIGIRAKQWRNTNVYQVIFSAVCIYAIFLILFSTTGSWNIIDMKTDSYEIAWSFGDNQNTEKVAAAPQTDQWVSAVIDSGKMTVEEIDWLRGYGLLLHNREKEKYEADERWQLIDVLTYAISESTARQMSIPVPEGVVDENHIYLLAWSENADFMGEDLINPFLKEYIKNVSVQRDIKEVERDDGFDEGMENLPYLASDTKRQICLFNGVYGDLHRLLPDTTYQTGLQQNSLLDGYVRQLVVYSDEYEK